MFRIVTIESVIKVPPEKFDKNVEKAMENTLKDSIVDTINPRVGIFLGIIKINEIGEGKIYPADPNIYYKVNFDALIYKPELNEIVYGEVIESTTFGSFVRIGPFDALIHISQTMDDFVSFNQKNRVLSGRETNRVLKEGDQVRARIVSVSIEGNNVKIGCTMRQIGLGALSWLEEERRKRGKKA